MRPNERGAALPRRASPICRRRVSAAKPRDWAGGQMSDTVILGAARTPIGAFLGGLAPVPAPKLGAIAIKCALERAGVRADEVDEVFMGNVVQAGVGQAPARQATLAAGSRNSVRWRAIN